LKNKQNHFLIQKMFTNEYVAESAIQSLITKDNKCSTHFSYRGGDAETLCTLNLITYNPVHKTHFLLHSLTAINKLTVINQMYEHVYKLTAALTPEDASCQSYTVEWYSKTQEKKYVSSFYGADMTAVLHKFYFGKHKESLIIYSIKLNPIC